MDKFGLAIFILMAIFIVTILTPQYIITKLANEGAQQSIENGIFINKTIDKVGILTEGINKGINVQLSQHGIHTDQELGDVNGNLTQLINNVSSLISTLNGTIIEGNNKQSYIIDAVDDIMRRLNITVNQTSTPTNEMK